MDIPNQSLIDTIGKIFACLCVFQTSLAIVLNPLVVFIILKSKQLRSTSTFKILTIGAFNDMLTSIGWNMEFFVYTMFDYVPSFTHLFFCRWFVSFLAYTTLGIESWLLLTISVDRLLSMMVKKWSKFYFAGYRPYILSLLLCFLIAALNFPNVLTVGYSYFDNETQTEIVMCYVTDPAFSFDWYTFLNLFSIFFGFVTPISILLIVNALIIYKATRFSRSQKAIGNVNIANMQLERKKTQMTKTVLFLTFFYIALSLPDQLYFGYLYSIIDLNVYGKLMGNLMDFIQFFYSSFHLFILYFSNKQFAIEVKSIIFRIRSSKVANSFGLTNPTIRSNHINSKRSNQHQTSTKI